VKSEQIAEKLSENKPDKDDLFAGIEDEGK
jgi:hypothetical protein